MDEKIDITYPMHEGMITFGASWHPSFQMTQLGRIHLEGRESRKVTFGTHTGTHMDAPRHFMENGRTIDQMPLDVMMGPVSIVDVSNLKKNESVLEDVVKNIPTTDRMIFKFGWGKHWNTKQFYKDWPFFTKEAARYLVSKGVRLVGIDTPSPDDSRIPFDSEQDSEIHKIFLGGNVALVEYIANLDKVTDYKGWNLVALPLKLQGADGSPIRAVLYR